MPAQHVQLLRDLRPRRYVAGVGIAGYQAQGLLLASTRYQNGWVRAAGVLRHLRRIERALQLEMLAPVGLVVPVLTAPHSQADLHRLLKHLEALPDRGVRNP